MKNLIKQLLSKSFQMGQHFGIDILPRHFYSEIPDMRKLKTTTWWRKELSMMGCSMGSLDEQLAFIGTLFNQEMFNELKNNDVYCKACKENECVGYGRVEADVLHAFVAKHRPKKIIQIGCGVSTAVCLNALGHQGNCELICIEPFPNDFLRHKHSQGFIRLISKPVQEIDADFVRELEAGDFFFVDSTHTLGPAGEVTRIILELLPRLNNGVFIHFHDVLFPYDFSDSILKKPLFFWHESALLQAFLTYNSTFTVLASLSLLHFKKQWELQALVPNYVPAVHQDGLKIKDGHYPSSIFIQKNSAVLK
jgi:hypothetical protein